MILVGYGIKSSIVNTKPPPFLWISLVSIISPINLSIKKWGYLYGRTFTRLDPCRMGVL